MEVSENRAVCNCQKCHGARKVIALTIKAQSEEEQDQLEAIRAPLKSGQRLHTAQDFQYAIERADWELDFVHFCQLLGLRENERDEHSLEMWRAFHALVGAVGRFDRSNLTKLIEFGLSLRDAAANGQLVISMQ